MSATLMTHSGKIKAQKISYDQLSLVPTPEPMGRLHKPVPHIQLVDTILGEISKRGCTVARQEYAVGANGAALFGVIDLAQCGKSPAAGAGLSMGFRSGNDQSMSIRVVAGARVFVCDNMALSGDLVAMVEKHTVGLNLIDEVAMGFDKFLAQADQLTGQIATLNSMHVSDIEAKGLIYDAFAKQLISVRLFKQVNEFYFNPQPEWTDVQPRTRWGVHNAFTRAMRAMPEIARFQATVAIGRHFGMTGQGDDAIEVQAVAADDVDAIDIE